MEIDILNASDEQLLEISEKGQLSLSLEEMKAIKEHFSKLGRKPTDVELETFAQTWSEHCVHKTFRGSIVTEDGEIDNLLKSTVARATEELKPEWCFSVFEDNAGIVDFEGDTAIAFKVETHNHPSALEPFGGAATGIGGVIRDILGVWGEPIANTDVLCFGPLDYPYEKLPRGVKHPRFIYTYVVSGIGNYGNNMGIPTVNGAVVFDEGYIGNPLVFCGTIGIVPKSRYARNVKAGDIVLLAGGKTGRDGIHGVTFASAELHEESQDVSATAVQIGDPIEEEKIKRAVLQIRDEELGSAITDLGGGGLSSAMGEMCHSYHLGARIHLDRVSLKYPNMLPWEIWTSESQERMLLCIPKENLDRALEIFRSEEVEATPLGEFIEEEKLWIEFEGAAVAELDIPFLFNVPCIKRRAEWKKPSFEEPDFLPKDLTQELLSVIAMPNIASKEAVIRTYDHEVKAATILKPLQGVECDSPGDAAVLKPLPGSWRGISISNGINTYGLIDPYWMAASAIDEAIRNNVAVGGRRIALLDNFCWGNPERSDRLGGLVRAAEACYDIAKSYGTPFISGKDSLYNESSFGPVLPTLLISALGIVPDVRKAVSMDVKEAGDCIYLLGETRNELGGSHYYRLKGYVGNRVPIVKADEAKKIMDGLLKAMDAGIVKACHDLSEGGLAVAAAEMAFAGGVGMEINITEAPTAGRMREDYLLFSESNSRFLVEVGDSNAGEFEKFMSGSYAKVGTTIEEEKLRIIMGNGRPISASLSELKNAWKGGLEGKK
ncbi:MAG: phosphoribosylformylglycinamidine synthase subunit PurL [Candidatus Hydrothermarchaeales archaeon]